MTQTYHNTAGCAAAAPARTAFFAGSFNPFTVGHASVVERALPLFDRIIIGVGVNALKADADADARVEAIRRLYRDCGGRVEVCAYQGLTVDAARNCGAGFLLRGVRSVRDFEYERDLADINRKLSGLETIIIYTLPEHAAISSSVVRELQAYGHDVSSFLPQAPQ